ncbi:hypothetical protein P7K49_035938 [Saguinus oedipus]|uniref:BZIP domain-containing protein n=1 Tax=Saguinus oedipus TaxID=9490 RepID=A0ABQ9TQ46_SAGOE|nr:hypothetical protein P7K49_035938 [Saguinus oedipus]
MGQRRSPEDDDRKVRRREKNRVAAQRSRKKQTQKADKLHEVRPWWGSHLRATQPLPLHRSGDDVTVLLITMSAALISNFCRVLPAHCKSGLNMYPEDKILDKIFHGTRLTSFQEGMVAVGIYVRHGQQLVAGHWMTTSTIGGLHT